MEDKIEYCECIQISCVLFQPDALFPGCVWVRSFEVSDKTPNFSVFRNAHRDLRWPEDRRLICIQDIDNDCGCGGRHRARKWRLIGHHHQQSEDGFRLKIQLLGGRCREQA